MGGIGLHLNEIRNDNVHEKHSDIISILTVSRLFVLGISLSKVFSQTCMEV